MLIETESKEIGGERIERNRRRETQERKVPAHDRGILSSSGGEFSTEARAKEGEKWSTMSSGPGDFEKSRRL